MALHPMPSAGSLTLGSASDGRKMYPTTADAYVLLEESGTGVSSVVWKAKCVPLNETVAVKVMDLERCLGSLDGVRKEALTMSMINHPNVVRALASFITGHLLYIVMPYLAAGSVLHIMKYAYPQACHRCHGLKEPVIATILKEALKGLDYLHRSGNIHRDIKAGNILVDLDGTVKLADFGVSAALAEGADRKMQRQTFVGTPHWMAPEVMEQVHGYDWRADIWSFGITCLELAHGHAPFSKYPPMKVLLMTLQGAPPTLQQEGHKGRFSKDFREVVDKCLVKDPAKRPSAEKLLKMSFFKHAHSSDYLVKALLEGLPSLGERVRRQKELVAAMRGGPPEDEQQKSLENYQKGISGWNFDLDDLKKEAANLDESGELIERHPATIPEEPADELQAAQSAQLAQLAPPPQAFDAARMLPPGVLQGVPQGMAPRRAPTAPSPPVQVAKAPQHRGRFDIYDGPLLSPESHDDRAEVAMQAMSQAASQGVRRGRFSVTSDDQPSPSSPTLKSSTSLHKSLSVNDVPSRAPLPQARSTTPPLVASSSVRQAEYDSQAQAAANLSHQSSMPPEQIMPQLQSLLEASAQQQQTLNTLIGALTSGTGVAPGADGHPIRQLPPLHFDTQHMLAMRGRAGMFDVHNELELLQRIQELQQQVASLMEENQSMKQRNVELERRLNAMLNEKLAQEDANND
eukprot:jgi/Chlat1/4799/Chrsp31S04792